MQVTKFTFHSMCKKSRKKTILDLTRAPLLVFGGGSENAKPENARLEDDRQKCRALKCRIGKYRTKV